MSSIDDKVSALEKDMIAVQVEMKLQFKEVFTRIGMALLLTSLVLNHSVRIQPS